VNDCPNCRFAGFQDAVTTSKTTRSTKDNPVQDTIRDRIMQQVGETGVDVVLLPLNFHNAHWCCVVIRVKAKRIFYYDPLNQASYLQSAQAISTFLRIAGLESYGVIQQNNPIQFDSFSCGVYVSWMFIRHAAGGQPLDMSVSSLPRRVLILGRAHVVYACIFLNYSR
jgi:Ulp1 family protease